jgi:hypothetical protein
VQKLKKLGVKSTKPPTDLMLSADPDADDHPDLKHLSDNAPNDVKEQT